MRLLSKLTHSPRSRSPELQTPELIDAFIDSRALEYATRIEDEFVDRALRLGVDGGMILDVGARVGLISLKLIYRDEEQNFISIGIDSSRVMIDRAMETAKAWGIDERARFQVGDARRMRLKTAYFDLVVSDSTLHCFDDPVSVLSEIERVLKPKGALLIRDLIRPNRFQMAASIERQTSRLGAQMRPHVEMALRSAFTREEVEDAVLASGLDRVTISQVDENHVTIERRGETDPNSWIKSRERYL